MHDKKKNKKRIKWKKNVKIKDSTHDVHLEAVIYDMRIF